MDSPRVSISGIVSQGAEAEEELVEVEVEVVVVVVLAVVGARAYVCLGVRVWNVPCLLTRHRDKKKVRWRDTEKRTLLELEIGGETIEGKTARGGRANKSMRSCDSARGAFKRCSAHNVKGEGLDSLDVLPVEDDDCLVFFGGGGWVRGRRVTRVY